MARIIQGNKANCIQILQVPMQGNERLNMPADVPLKLKDYLELADR